MSPNSNAEFKEDARRSWSSVALGWKKWWPVFEAGAQVLSDRMLDLAGVRAGTRVLDVATGIGEPALSAARRGAHVVGVDFAPDMVALARERAGAHGLANAEFREADAEQLPPDLADFDAATCRWGLMLVGEPERAAACIRRALAPGGRFAAAVWGPPGTVPFIELPAAIAQRELGLPPPAPGTPGPLTMGAPGRIESVLQAAAFRDVRCEELSLEIVFESAARYREFVIELSGSMRRALENQDEAAVERVGRAVEHTASAHRAADGRVRFVNRVRVASAMR